MKKNIMKWLFILIVVFVIINIAYLIISNINKTYIVLDYDNILKVDKEKVEKVSINKIRHLNYTNSYLLKDNEKINGYLDIDHDAYEVNFYDKSMNKNYDGTIIIDDNENVDKISMVTESLTQSDSTFINNILDEHSIKVDIDTTDVYITKAIINSNDAVYNILYHDNNEILSMVFIKNGSDIQEVYNKKVTDDYYGILRGIIVLKNNTNPLILMSHTKPDSDYSVCTSVYTYNQDKYVPIIKCEGE